MRRQQPRGVILILVLVVVAMLALVTMSFSDLMLNERRAAVAACRQSQARALAQSGAEFARQFLDRDPKSQAAAGGIYDNPQRFRGALVLDGETPRDRGRFAIVAPRMDDQTVTGVRYGLQDESNRINLNTILQAESRIPGASKAMLMALPGMTDAIADAILDWIDSDSKPREQGAEVEYYGSLRPGYSPRNGSLGSIEELLLVRGVTPQLLFGADAARMGYNTLEGAADGGLTGFGSAMEHGWAAYLTLHSAEANASEPTQQTDKIDLNDDDLQTMYDRLKTALDEKSALFIVAYRAYGGTPATTPEAGATEAGGTSTTGAGASSTTGTGASAAKETNAATPATTTATASDVDVSKLKPTIKISSILDLIGATVTISPQVEAPPAGGQDAGKSGSGRTSGNSDNKSSTAQSTPATPAGPKTLPSPFTEDPAALSSYLPKLLAATTARTTPPPGRININQAPRVVLLCIPGMTTDMVDQIISKRVPDPMMSNTDHTSELWPLVEGIMPLKTMKAIYPFITAGGSVYRAQIMGRFDQGAPTARLEVILDASNPPTKLLSWKDISRQATGFPAEPRAGE